MEHRRVLVVQILQRVQKLRSPQQHLRLRQALLLAQHPGQNLLQIPALDKIHHQIFARILGKIIRHLGQIGMIEPGQDAGLLVKLFNRLGDIQLRPLVANQQIGHDLLDRAYPPIQTQIVGPVDRAHSALAHQPHNFVARAAEWRPLLRPQPRVTSAK